MFDNILVGYDGSTGAERALDKAIQLAKLSDASLNVLTVYRRHSMLEASLSMVRASDPERLDDVMRGAAREAADRAKRHAQQQGVEKVRAFIKSGPPARTIVAFARKHGLDLIVVGARGVGSAENYLLGSVSHKVTGIAPMPVLVV
ncbi:universal stress protein [Paracoccus jeotgali]|uniref:Universal stress protein UspA n=1 Tax=Paracoccus jeotgali TaxID=2065379 RepID=A0A2K9MCE4_9RHOB|nr:universal stress protein [Paracoccus jeotgali]AUM73308.1 universal stress protein UspA [Paracoccus jeotgali]